MVDRSPGLKVQASHAIAQCELRKQQVQVCIGKADENDNATVPVETLMSLRILLEDLAKLVQKQDKKIDDLNNQLFNL